jgi:hypothetical protein
MEESRNEPAVMAASFPVGLEWSARESDNFIDLFHNEDERGHTMRQWLWRR